MQLLLSCRAHVWLLRNPMDAHHFLSMGFPKQEDWFSSVQSLSCIQLFATPWTEAREDSLSIINSWSLLRLISIELVMLSNHLILCHPLFLPFQSFSALGSFPKSWLFTSGGQSIEASAWAPALPMNFQGWLPLGLTDLISLQSKGLSRVFSSTTFWKYLFFYAQPSLWSNSHTRPWLLEKP